jgi:hypothetical protein|tara:strand:- start:92 stop:559 length:468 start_codon:yes stop_codon:yes gene_type:complete
MAKSHPSDRRAEFANDTKTIKNLTAALYEAICFDADRPQDWDRISNLVIPEGRFGFSMGNPFVFLTLDDFKEFATEHMKAAEEKFIEEEISQVVLEFGCIAHVSSSYSGVYDDGKLIRRGINSIQLMHEDDRWWLVSMIWDDESPENPLPSEYLP